MHPFQPTPKTWKASFGAMEPRPCDQITSCDSHGARHGLAWVQVGARHSGLLCQLSPVVTSQPDFDVQCARATPMFCLASQHCVGPRLGLWRMLALCCVCCCGGCEVFALLGWTMYSQIYDIPSLCWRVQLCQGHRHTILFCDAVHHQELNSQVML